MFNEHLLDDTCTASPSPVRPLSSNAPSADGPLDADCSVSGDSLSPRDRQRVAEILDNYLQRLEAGEAASAEELLDAHPELAERLRGYLSGLRLVGAATGGVSTAEADASDSADDASASDNRLGDYELIREIGRGGMGVVYEARQVSLDRRVALKILPFGSVLDRRQLVRFQNEAQAAAQVNHPNIAPVFAVGHDKGVHFYAMQYIEGHSLAQLIHDTTAHSPAERTVVTTGRGDDADRGRKGPAATGAASPLKANVEMCPETPLSSGDTLDRVRMVARLGIQAAEALHAAHEFGVVHRDVKPSNLLLDDDGKLWVTDFGVARCQKQDSLTATGDLLGTMRYMSPEQALGVPALVDHRSDVYSLGVTLYQLAAGRHPLADVSESDLLWELRQPRVRPLRHLNAEIPRDFETVVIKAMTVTRDDRYATARELAADLSRFLRNEPVQARRPSLSSRVTKWVKRHATVVAASLCVSLLAALGLLAGVLMISHEKRLAEASYRLEQQRTAMAHEMVDRLGMQPAADMAGIPQLLNFRRSQLERTLAYYEQFARESADRAQFDVELARAYNSIGHINSQLGHPAAARESYAKALDVLARAAGARYREPEYARQLARAHNNVGQLLVDGGALAEAHRHLDEAVALQRGLVERFPDVPTYRGELGDTLGNLGLALLAEGRRDNAGAALAESRDVYEQLLALDPQNEVYLKGSAAAYNNLSGLGDGEALNHRLAARDRQQQLAARHPDNLALASDLAVTLNNIAVLYRRRGDLERAETNCREAIARGEALIAEAPDVPQYRRDLAISHNTLGMVRRDQALLEPAIESFQTSAELLLDLEAAQGDANTLSRLGGVYNNLGMVYMDRQEWDKARGMFAEAAQRQRAALESAPQMTFYRESLSKHYFNLASCLRRLGLPAAALDVSRQRRQLWPESPERLLSVAEEMAATVAIVDDETNAASDRLRELRQTCIAEATQSLREAVAAGLRELPSPSTAPWSLLVPPGESAEWLAEIRSAATIVPMTTGASRNKSVAGELVSGDILSGDVAGEGERR